MYTVVRSTWLLLLLNVKVGEVQSEVALEQLVKGCAPLWVNDTTVPDYCVIHETTNFPVQMSNATCDTYGGEFVLAQDISFPQCCFPSRTACENATTMMNNVANNCNAGQFRIANASAGGLSVCWEQCYPNQYMLIQPSFYIDNKGDPDFTGSGLCAPLSNPCPIGFYQAEVEKCASSVSTNFLFQNHWSLNFTQYSQRWEAPPNWSALTAYPDPLPCDITDVSKIHLYGDGNPVVIQNAVCKIPTNCTNHQYQLAPYTETTDSVCANVTMCDPENEFMELAATKYADTLCATLTVCGPTEWQLLPPTMSSNRACEEVAYCPLDQNLYQEAAPTLTSNRVCANLRPMCDKATQYQLKAPTHTSDRVCSSLTVCDNHYHQLTAPTYTTNRVCVGMTETRTHQQLTRGGDAGVVIGLLVLIAVALLVAFYWVKDKKQHAFESSNFELNQRLLEDHITRMQIGWQLSKDEVVFEGIIAMGAYGTVRSGKWGHVKVAIKTLHQGIAEFDPEAVEEFQQEASRMQSIRHPNLVTFYGAGTVDGEPFLVFELMSHGALRTLLASSKELSVLQRVKFAHDIAKGMTHLHSISMIHRDLKSDNVLIGQACLTEEMFAKVADFGQSRLMIGAGAQRNDSTNRANGAKACHDVSYGSATNNDFHSTFGTMTLNVGTPVWNAPELFSNDANYDKTIDLYSFAIVMWELMTRKTPWEDIDGSGYTFVKNLRTALLGGARPPVPANPQVSAAYVELMTACWSAQPSQRTSFQHALSVLSLEVKTETQRHTDMFTNEDGGDDDDDNDDTDDDGNDDNGNNNNKNANNNNSNNDDINTNNSNNSDNTNDDDDDNNTSYIMIESSPSTVSEHVL